MEGSSTENVDATQPRVPGNHSLLRNFRHKALLNPYSCPFDDHEVSTLASVFKEFRPIYNANPESFVASLFENVVGPCLKKANTYDDLKKDNRVTPKKPSIDSLRVLLSQFSRMDDKQLTSWGERFCSFPPLKRCLLGSTDSQIISGTARLLIIRPKIAACIFCPEAQLVVQTTTTKAGGKAKGGFCWAYDEHGGAKTAILCKGTCTKCQTVYSLQTYTPGQVVMEKIGLCGENLTNLLLPPEQQNAEWLQLNSVTLVNFNIINFWHTLKMSCPSISIKGVSDILATRWGCDSRTTIGTKRSFNEMPSKKTVRDTVCKSSGGDRYMIGEKRLGDAIILGSIVMILNMHTKSHPCTRRLNFLGDKEELAIALVPVLTLLNLELFVQHAAQCPDPTCGFVISIDGTCKVFRECCGHSLDPGQDDVIYDTGESLVHNAISNGFIRDTVCPETPTRGSRHGRFCKKCLQRMAIQQCDAEEHRSQTVDTNPSSTQRQLRSATAQHRSTVADAETEILHDNLQTQENIVPCNSNEEADADKEESSDIDFSHLGWHLDKIIEMQQKNIESWSEQDASQEYVVDSIIGVKPGPRKKLMYLTTFKGYGIRDAWWCYYSDLIGKTTKQQADKLRLEYLLSGSQLDTFVTSHLDIEDVKKIATALEDSLKDQGANSNMLQTFQKHLSECCAQDLCEQGVPREVFAKAYRRAKAQLDGNLSQCPTDSLIRDPSVLNKQDLNTVHIDDPHPSTEDEGLQTDMAHEPLAFNNTAVHTEFHTPSQSDSEATKSEHLDNLPSRDTGEITSHALHNQENLDAGNAGNAGEVLDEGDDNPVFECPPKDFSRAETEQGRFRTRTTKGTLQFMSPCGAKIYCTEMVKSESMAVLFHSLSSFMPLIAADLKRVRAEKIQQMESMFRNPRTKKTCKFPKLPIAEALPGFNNDGQEADFLFVYDFACGALASLKARLRRLQQLEKDVPECVKSWATRCKWLVDKFHYKSHVGRLCKKHCNPNREAVSDWVNWSCQEQVFKEWNRQKHSTRKMSMGSFRLMCQIDVYYSLRSKM